MYQGKSPIIVFMAIRKPTKKIQECSNVYNPDFVIPTCRRSLVAQQELSMLGPKTLYSAHAHTWFLSKDVRILRFGSDLQWSQKVVSGYSFSPTKVHMFRESTVSNEKDKTAFYCTVSAFICAARHTMMLRDQNTSNYSFSLSSSLSMEKWLIISLLFTSTACNPPLSGSKGACWDFTEGACDLSETNIIDHDRFVDSPEECQVTAMII